MTITPSLFEAFLKCPTKCWLRATNETPSANTYAEWVQSQNESFRAAQGERVLAETPPGESARSPAQAQIIHRLAARITSGYVGGDMTFRAPHGPAVVGAEVTRL